MGAAGGYSRLLPIWLPSLNAWLLSTENGERGGRKRDVWIDDKRGAVEHERHRRPWGVGKINKVWGEKNKAIIWRWYRKERRGIEQETEGKGEQKRGGESVLITVFTWLIFMHTTWLCTFEKARRCHAAWGDAVLMCETTVQYKTPDALRRLECSDSSAVAPLV